MKEPRVSRGDAPQNPICNLNIQIPDGIKSENSGNLDAEALEALQNKYNTQKDGEESSGKKKSIMNLFFEIF